MSQYQGHTQAVTPPFWKGERKDPPILFSLTILKDSKSALPIGDKALPESRGLLF